MGRKRSRGEGDPAVGVSRSARKAPPKRRPEDLAYFGGTPAFTRLLHVGQPNVGNPERFLARVEDMLRRRWFTNDGPLVRELESRIAARTGVRHVVATANATVALELLVRALDLGGQVIVPSFTFVATAHALRWHGIRPVFCDIDPDTHNLDPKRVVERITPATTAILGVHLWGRGCAIEPLTDISRRHGLRLIFDAAHAFDCTHGGKPIGNFGTAEVMSFHATKFFNTFEGGAVLTHDAELARRLRLMRNFGFSGIDTVVSLGINAKMSEVNAAMGLTGLDSIEQFESVNRAHHARYRNGLAGLPGITLAGYPEGERHNHQYVVVEVDAEAAGMSRDLLMEILRAENILARRYFHPGCHRMEPYASEGPGAHECLKETERLASRVLVLPTGTGVSAEDIGLICRVIGIAVRGAHEPGMERVA